MTDAFPVGEYVADELEARGWTTAYAATLFDGPGDTNTNHLWLDLLCCLPAWEKHEISFSEEEAKRLEQLFGVRWQVWMGLHEAYRRARAGNGPDEVDAGGGNG